MFRVVPPSPPRGPIRVSDVTSSSCQVRWAPPEDNRSSAISSYIIELRDVTQTKWRRVAIVDATTFHYRVTSLREGEEYYVRVIARNRDGDSLPAQSSLVSTKKSFCESDKPNHGFLS